MDQPWRIEMLGWLRVVQPDRIVTRFRTRKAGALLAYLAYHPHRSHPREQLIELLWPDSDPTGGRSNLRSELASLRRQLEPPGVPTGAVLLADRTTLQLNAATCATDVALFETALSAASKAVNPAGKAEQLTAAVEVYGGELLPGFFEDWLLPERQRLAEAHLQALHSLVALLEEMGDQPQALQWARRALAADPLCEDSHERLIRLLIATDQIEAARAQYEQGQHLLLRELGSGLSPEIHTLVKNLAPSKDWPPPAQAGQRRKPRRLGVRNHEPELPATGPGASPALNHGEGVTPAPPLSGAPARPGDNLPLRLTRFFGREREIERLCDLLGPRGTAEFGVGSASEAIRNPKSESQNRLVTLTGPGGTGKTRLALQVAQRLRGAFPGGVWFVSLLDLTDPALIPDQILLALRLPRSPQREALEQVVTFLSQAPVLLVLDNFEHLIEGGAETARIFLEQVEHLTVLATSRQCLALEGEREFPVAPLPTPDPSRDREGAEARACPPALPHGPGTPRREGVSDPTSLIACPSVALFLDRAQAVRPDFQVTTHNAPAVAALCQRLEGLPLAIELAAARAWALTPEQMLARVEQRFELLVGRQRSTDPRHRSLRATLDWSHQLLSPEVRRFFARLSVFRGGWTVEAAAAVCEEPKALEYLEHLRACSLVQSTETVAGTAEHSEVVMRFHLLETLREYGTEQLADEDRSAVARQHAQFFLALAEAAEPELVGPDQDLWLDRLEREHDNLRAALAWSVEGGEPQLGLRLGGALQEFWSVRGYHREGFEQLLRLVSQPGAEEGTAARAMALCGAGRFAWFHDLDTARALIEESLAIRRTLQDRRGIGESLHYLGSVVHQQGDLETARALVEESLAIHRELGDKRGAASNLGTLSWISQTRGEMPTARALCEESLAIWRELEDRAGLVGALGSLGCMAYFQGELDTARALFEEMLAAATEVGDKVHMAWGITHLGWVAFEREEYAAARALFGQSLPIWRELRDNNGLTCALLCLGWTAHHQGDYTTAHALFVELLAVSREWGSEKSVADALASLAVTAGRLGDWDQATTLFTECLYLFGHGERCDRLALYICFPGLAQLADVCGNPARAARLLGTWEALQAASGGGPHPDDRREVDRSQAAARAQLGEAGFAAAWAEGQAMPLDQAIALALQEITGD